MNSSSTGEKAVRTAGHAANIARNSAQLAANIAAQNHAGAAFNVAMLLPYAIAITVFLLVVTLVVFLCLPALILDHLLSSEPIPKLELNSAIVQEGVVEFYGDYVSQTLGQVDSIVSGFLSEVVDVIPDFGALFNVTREVNKTGSLIDITWYVALHSAYFGNDTANITPEKTAEFIAGIFAYNITDAIVGVIDATPISPLILTVTRTLNVDFKEPHDIMEHFGFDSQQRQWAELLNSTLSGEYDDNSNEQN